MIHNLTQNRRGSLLIRGIVSVFLPFLFVSCVGITDLSRENYRRGILKADALSKARLAVLPMVAMGNNRNYVQASEAIFFKALTEMRQSMEIISPEEGLTRLKQAELSPFVQRLEKESPFGKVVEEGDLLKFKKAFGTRFVLQTELQQVAIVEGATHVRIRGRIWDIEVGDIIWEGTGESRGYLLLFFPRAPVSFERAIETASRGLIRKLP